MKLTYLGVLFFILLATGWLEVVLRTRVYSRFRRLALTMLVPVVVFVIWDLYAINADHWGFNPDYTSGILLGILPLEELLFFIVIPIASVLSVEAVRSVKGWPLGDEAPADGAPHPPPVLPSAIWRTRFRRNSCTPDSTRQSQGEGVRDSNPGDPNATDPNPGDPRPREDRPRS